MSTYDAPVPEHPAPPEPPGAEPPPELPPELREPRRPSGWHRVDVGHLVMGVALLGLAAVWALVASDTLQLSESRWVLPLPWLVAGAVGLVATVARGRRTP